MLEDKPIYSQGGSFGCDAKNVCYEEIEQAMKDEYNEKCIYSCSNSKISIFKDRKSSPNKTHTFITAYFYDLNILYVTQVEKVTFASLVSNIGGTIGLFLGMSL